MYVHVWLNLFTQGFRVPIWVDCGCGDAVPSGWGIVPSHLLHLFASILSDFLQFLANVCHGPNLAVHVSLLPAAKQAIVASKTTNISLICHQCTNTICAVEVPPVFKTRTDAIYAAAWDGDRRYQQQGEKKRGDGHYRLKYLGKTSDGNNCEAHRVVIGSNEAYRWQQLKPHTCTVAGVVQYVASTAIASDLLLAPICLPPPSSLHLSFLPHTFMAWWDRPGSTTFWDPHDHVCTTLEAAFAMAHGVDLAN